MKKSKFLIILAFSGFIFLSQNVKAEEQRTLKELDISTIHLAVEDAGLKAKAEKHEEKTGILKSTVEFCDKTRQFQTGLSEKGYSIEFAHTNDSMMNFKGLLNSKTAVKSMSLLDMSLSLDTEKMGLWKGGTGFVLGQTIYGKGLTGGRLGDLQTVSSIEAPARTQLSEFWYEQKLFNDKFRVATGKHDANGEFGILGMAEDYLGSSFTLMPNIPMPSYPDQAIGVWGEISPIKLVSLKAGIYDGGARGDDLGFRTAFNGKGGYITLVQGGLNPSIKGHDGNYIVGWWTHSKNLETIGVDDVQSRSNNYGIYTAFQQMLWKEKETEDQGLSLMGQFSWTPSDRNEIARYYGAGCTYKGLIPKRDEDILGAGMALADLSKRHQVYNGLQNETVLEFFYKMVLNDIFTIQPDFQVILHNGGGNPTAYALGIRTIVSLGPKSPEKI
jgi:porin